MKNWCKVVEYEKIDVLVRRMRDFDDDMPEKVVVTVNTESGYMDMTFGYDDKIAADSAYEKTEGDNLKDLLTRSILPIVEEYF